jgi:hypothetical protein
MALQHGQTQLLALPKGLVKQFWEAHASIREILSDDVFGEYVQRLGGQTPEKMKKLQKLLKAVCYGAISKQDFSSFNQGARKYIGNRLNGHRQYLENMVHWLEEQGIIHDGVIHDLIHDIDLFLRTGRLILQDRNHREIWAANCRAMGCKEVQDELERSKQEYDKKQQAKQQAVKQKSRHSVQSGSWGQRGGPRRTPPNNGRSQMARGPRSSGFVICQDTPTSAGGFAAREPI